MYRFLCVSTPVPRWSRRERLFAADSLTPLRGWTAACPPGRSVPGEGCRSGNTDSHSGPRGCWCSSLATRRRGRRSWHGAVPRCPRRPPRPRPRRPRRRSAGPAARCSGSGWAASLPLDPLDGHLPARGRVPVDEAPTRSLS